MFPDRQYRSRSVIAKVEKTAMTMTQQFFPSISQATAGDKHSMQTPITDLKRALGGRMPSS